MVQANGEGQVTISNPAGLRVLIPKGVVREEGQVAQLLVDAAQARDGDVVVRVSDQGRRAVPLSLVRDGQALYVADAPGQYILERGGASFADMTDHWAREAVDFAADRELVRGMGEGRYDPERYATRAMVFTLLARLEEVDLPASQGMWYDSAVTWAMDRGLTDGTRPQAEVTREELVTLLWRWAGQPAPQGELTGFADLWQVSPYAREPLAWAAENGILRGRPDATIDPAAGATRAETAVILQRFITYLVEQRTGG